MGFQEGKLDEGQKNGVNNNSEEINNGLKKGNLNDIIDAYQKIDPDLSKQVADEIIIGFN